MKNKVFRICRKAGNIDSNLITTAYTLAATYYLYNLLFAGVPDVDPMFLFGMLVGLMGFSFLLVTVVNAVVFSLLSVVTNIANQKGGVGKTVSAVTLAHGAALAGKSVLLVDLDPQGNVADSLGMQEGNELVKTLDGFRCAVEPRDTLDHFNVIRSDKLTAAYKTILAGRDYRELVIKEALYDMPYELILLDCAPSIDVLHVAALTAADYLVIPTKLDQYSIKGVLEIMRTMAAVQKRGAHLSLAGIVPTFYDRTTRETQAQLEHLAARFGPSVWPVIPQDVTICQANRLGKTLWEYAPTCRAITGIDGIGGGYQSVLSRLLALK